MSDFEEDMESDNSESQDSSLKGKKGGSENKKKSKVLRTPCSEDVCVLQCTKQITENQRRQILKYFYGLGDINLRRLFVQKCVERNVDNKKEDVSLCTYYFTINGKRLKVCKTFFLSTLAISFGFVLRSLEIIFDDQVSSNGNKNLPNPENKKSVSDNKRPLEYNNTPEAKKSATEYKKPAVDSRKLYPKVEEGIASHIKSVPRIVACVVENGKRVYVEYSIKVETMYQLYIAYCKEHSYLPASMIRYKEIYEQQNVVFRKCQESLPMLKENEVTIVTLKSHTINKK